MVLVRSDVAIVGGGFGGVAAALALTDRGYSVTMTEEYPWIGGQVTSQALCVLDDLNDPSGEKVGISRRYAQFRSRTREWYAKRYRLSALGRAQLHLCVGNARCSHLTAEPNVAHECILDWVRPVVASGKLTILLGMVPVASERSADRVRSITCRSCSGPDRTVTVTADFFLDATETGDTYPVLNLPYRLGSESRDEFSEPHAVDRADRTAVQCFTFCSVVEYVPGGRFLIPKPANYEAIRDRQGFCLSSAGATAEEPAYLFKPRILKDGRRVVPFWFYRCVVDAGNFENLTGRAVINVKSTDYNDAAYLENPRREQVLEEARQVARAYLYWLQTEAPRDEGGRGYPELRPMPEATGTPDGVAMAPYVREGRRLRACQTIIEQDLAAAFNPQARARHYPDAVGLGAYAIDIHSRSGLSAPGVWEESRPYQVPLRAMLSPDLANFAVAGKCIGVSQVANGAYRLHPVEWAIGEAAGELAAFCLGNGTMPPLIGRALLEYQRQLVQVGIPLYWYEDMPFDHLGFEASQRLAAAGIWPGAQDHLRFDGEQSLGHHRKVFEQIMDRLAAAGVQVEPLRQACLNAHNARKYDVVHRVMKLLDGQGWPSSLLS